VELEEAMRSRRSVRHLVNPAPTDSEFIRMLDLAASAPDHGRIRPWRWILVRGHARAALDQSFTAMNSAMQGKALRAPLLATSVFCPRIQAGIPEWEQMAAASAMIDSLTLLLHDARFGSIWRTGKLVDSPDARVALDISAEERLLGWLYIGTPDPTKHERAARNAYDISTHVSVFSPQSCWQPSDRQSAGSSRARITT
jgi:nitroreductase